MTSSANFATAQVLQHKKFCRAMKPAARRALNALLSFVLVEVFIDIDTLYPF